MADLFDIWGAAEECSADHKAGYESFRNFHRANPRVFEIFRQFAEQALTKGNRKRFGARMIGERIRWYTAVETSDPEFKVNNNYWPYYARLLGLVDDRFCEFFERRGGGNDVTDEQLIEECGK